MDLTWDGVQVFLEEHVGPFAIRVAVALFIFIVGRWVSRALVRGSGRLMERSQIDISLRKFLGDVLYAILLVAVVTVSLDSLGIRTTAVVAVLGAAGLAVGLALRDSLSNFAAGVMIIVLRHYKVGDTIVVAAGKYTGRVDAIKVFHTILHTADHRQVTVPNGQIITAPIENTTALGRRRLNLKVTVAHDANLRQVKEMIEGVALAESRILDEPRPQVEVAEIGMDAVILTMKPWVGVHDAQAVATALVERVHATLDDEPFKYAVAVDPV